MRKGAARGIDSPAEEPRVKRRVPGGGGDGAAVRESGGAASPWSPFDVRLARFACVEVSLEDLIDPLAVGHAAAVVERYRAAMARGERFPPPSVVSIAGALLVADGHKRVAAARALLAARPAGARPLVVEVWPWRVWASDQLGQLRRSVRRQAPAVAALLSADATRRAEARAVLAVLAAHQRRLLRSGAHWGRRLLGAGSLARQGGPAEARNAASDAAVSSGRSRCG